MQRLIEDMATSHVGRVALVLSNTVTASGLNKAKAMGVKTKLIDHDLYDAELQTFDDTLHEYPLAHSTVYCHHHCRSADKCHWP